MRAAARRDSVASSRFHPLGRQIVQYAITAVSVFAVVLFGYKVTTLAPSAGMIPPSMLEREPESLEPVKVG